MKKWNSKEILSLIESRRSIYPHMYTEERIADDLVGQILESARWAPTHKHTEPWMFKVFAGESRERLGNFLAEEYKKKMPPEKFLERKYLKAKTNPLRSSHVIAICMQRDPLESIPEWEEIASVAMAVQNMWLSSHALGLACYWSSPATIVDNKDFLNLKEGQRCLGLLYMGVPKAGLNLEVKREEMSEKVEWM